jgi:3-hydroxybutyryl-CoA dehydrogenase
MGSGIAQVAATSGYEVTLADLNSDALTRGKERILDSLSRFVASQRLTTEASQAAFARIRMTTDSNAAAASVDLVIESIVEDLAIKQALFKALDQICSPDVVLATNTSQYPIGQIAENTSNPQRIIGMHWSNPPPLMPLVEVNPGHASQDVLTAVLDFIRSCNHQSVVCKKDLAGFISTRLFQALVLEAMRIIDDGLATPKDVDDVARLMHGHKMGPLAAADFAGLDTTLRVSQALSEVYGSRFSASSILEDLVAQGRNGRKSGKGFYEYENQ